MILYGELELDLIRNFQKVNFHGSSANVKL